MGERFFDPMAKLTFCGADVNESNAATLTRARAVCNELWHRLCALDCTHCSTPMQLGNRGGAPRIRAAWYSVGIKATCKGHAKPRADCERRTARPPGVDGTTMRHAEAVPRVGTSVVTRGVCILDQLVGPPPPPPLRLPVPPPVRAGALCLWPWQTSHWPARASTLQLAHCWRRLRRGW